VKVGCDYDLAMKFPLSALFLAAVCAWPAVAPAQDPVKVENSALSGELLYEILLGEMNLREGQPAAAYSLILDAARKSNDSRLYGQAVEIALKARSGDGALKAARAWTQAFPQDREANSQLLQILLALNQVNDSLEPLMQELALAPNAERVEVIHLIPRHYARVSDKSKATEVVQVALQPYMHQNDLSATAWTTLGRLRIASEDLPGALDAAQKGHQADTRATAPALLAMELMGKQVTAAEAVVTDTLRKQSSPELAMGYVRVLIELQRYDDAYQQLQTLTNKNPKFADAWLVLGSMQFEKNELAPAEASLSRYVALAKDDPRQTRGIAQAQARRAAMYVKQGKVNEARQLIRSMPANTPEDERVRLTTEVQLLRDLRQWQEAFDLLDRSQIQEDIDLVYEQAMLAEKLNRMDMMEKLLRQVMAQNAEYYNAYNALGFSLADRNVRLQEAKELIVKALSFAPEDPFITDSLGWVEFRLGNLAAALTQLQKAYKIRPDVEIAAHLGEVLWKLNRKDEALQVWQEGLKAAPDNETLQETLRRLQPKL
jgi:tetratricopeptide (TPR) repeat protein